MKRHSDSFIVTVDKEDNYHLIDHLELNKYALKAQVDPDSGSKYTPSEDLLTGNNILDPKYNPYYLVQLLDLTLTTQVVLRQWQWIPLVSVTV
jgi:hypothetical protein